jgi:adenylate cyclase
LPPTPLLIVNIFPPCPTQEKLNRRRPLPVLPDLLPLFFKLETTELMGNSTSDYATRASSLETVGVGSPQLLRLLDSIRLCGQCDSLEESVDLIVRETCATLGCDRATVFLVDNIREQLVITTSDSEAPDIRIPWSAGLAGHVYQSGETINIPDAYKDDRFSKTTDTKTGYKTTSLMCCPVRDANDNIVAVMQCINKMKEGSGSTEAIPFGDTDLMLMGYLQSQVGVILRNAVTRQALKIESGRVSALLDIVKSLNAGMGTASLIFTITNRTPALVNADRCTVYMVDPNREELWSMQGAVEIRFPMNSGIAGAVVASQNTVNIKDVYEDSRFNQEFDKKTGYRTKSVLCMPIFSTEQKVIAVIQLINKLDGSPVGFTEQDERLLSGFLDIAGSILEQSQIFQKQKVQLSEMDVIMGGGGKGKSSESVSSVMGGMTITEGDEEEEEEEDEDDDGGF